MAVAAARRPPLRPEPDSLARRTDKTVYVYRRAVAQFMSWVTVHGLVIRNYWELDDLLVEFKNQAALAKAAFAQLVCAAEMAIPMAKGQLTWAHALLADMAHSRPTAHHIPLPFSLAIVIATVMAAAGYARMGAGLILQQQRALRPSEMLKLQRQDVVLPNEQFFGSQSAVINLGACGGTTLKRSQAVLVTTDRHPQALMCLEALCRSTPPHQFLLFGVELPMYQRILTQVCAALDLPPFTPHSARAGMPTDQFLAGRDFVSIRDGQATPVYASTSTLLPPRRWQHHPRHTAERPPQRT